MRWLVAARGDRVNDFTWTRDGEPVTLGMACCNSKRCGCDRSFSGLDTRKATTVAVLGEVDLDLTDLAARDLSGFYGGADAWAALPERDREELTRSTLTTLRSLERAIAKIPAGAQVRVFRGRLTWEVTS